MTARALDELGASAPGRVASAVAVAALTLASLVAVVAGDGDLEVAIAPPAIALAVFAMWRLPLRDTLPALAFLCLTLENPSEAPAALKWRSPLYEVGALFLNHMNLVLPVKALFFSGLDVTLLLLVVIVIFRRVSGSRVDDHAFVPVAPPVRAGALACLAAIAWVWAFGMARGGSFGSSLWQLFRVVYLPVVILLFASGLRGPRDAKRLATVLVVAAVLRASIAIYVRALFPDTEQVPFTTVHADSMLFANAILLVVAVVLERPGRGARHLALLVLPVVSWGMIANNRRLGWVELGLGLVAILLVMRRTLLKRRLLQAAVVMAPLLLAYVVVGWGRPTGVFAPVGTIRSVVDSDFDTSTAWRDWENYDLYATLRRNPLLGTGFGHEYDEVVRLPDISDSYTLYRYAPHNSVLGLLAYGGLVGFAGLWMLIPLGVFFAVRSYRYATDPSDRVAALTALGVLVTYLVHCYGDMGLGTFTSVFTVGPAIALVGKIAVATGAWPVRAGSKNRLSARNGFSSSS